MDNMLSLEDFEAFRNGDKKITDKLLIRYHLPLIFFCENILKNRQDAEETANDVLLKIPAAGIVCHTVKHLNNWIYLVARNESINRLEKDRSHNAIFKSFSPDLLAQMTEDPKGNDLLDIIEAEAKARYQIIHNAIQQFSPKRRQILILRIFAGKSNSEIAAMLDIPRTLVSQHSTNSWDLLLAELHKHGFYCWIILLCKIIS